MPEEPKKYPNSKISYIGEGWSSICFQVDDYIYKFSKQYFEDFIFEKKVSDCIRDGITFELQRIELNHHRSYSMYKKLKGELGSEYLLRHHNEADELSKDCALFLHQIHSYSCKDLNWVRNAPQSSDNIEELTSFLSELIKNKSYEELIINNYQRISENVIKNPVLIHGDFYGSNFTVDNSGRLSGIFDWCNGGLGEREFDFVALYIHHGKRFSDKVISEYKCLTDVCLSEHRIKDLVWFRLINRMIYASYKNKRDLWIQLQKFYANNQEDYGGMLYHESLFI